MLSRYPDKDDNEGSNLVPSCDSEFTETIEVNPVFGSPALATVSQQRLAESTNADTTLQSGISFVKSWFLRKPTDFDLLPFYIVCQELSIVDGIFNRRERSVIPSEQRNELLDLAH